MAKIIRLATAILLGCTGSCSVWAQNATKAVVPPASLSLPASYVAPGFFPTNVFKGFFSGYEATQTSQEPQPQITNGVGSTYGLSDIGPKATDTPNQNYYDPVVYGPSSLNASSAGIGYIIEAKTNLSTNYTLALAQTAYAQIVNIIADNSTSSNCTKCLNGLVVAQNLSRIAPWEIPNLLVNLCNRYNYNAKISCAAQFAQQADGAMAAQVISQFDPTGLDGRYVCWNFINKACPMPTTPALDLTGWFSKPKPANATAPIPSGQRIKVAHISDFHLDPHYAVGSEANCTNGLCCQSSSINSVSPNTTSMPAARFGAFKCDVPYDLAGSVIQSFPILTGANGSNPVNFTIFTGDLVTHLQDSQMNQNLIEYTEDSVFSMMKSFLGNGPVYAALGNHDTLPIAADAPHSINVSAIANEFSWNYNHVSKLWESLGWISSDVQAVSASHYGAYSTKTPGPAGLRIITTNTDMWYPNNYFSFIRMTDSDTFGILRFLTDELQKAEDNGERVWIIGHVLSGWSGTNTLTGPSNLFQAIIDRYSPHVIAGSFMGHIHEDAISIFYRNNATNISAANAVSVQWMGPSITPLTNLNSGFRMYEVDSQTFDVMDSYTWIANVSNFAALDSQTSYGPTWQYEYSARETYGGNISWPANAPLNATWWHLVTEQMAINPSLVSTQQFLQSKSSVNTPNCTNSACQAAKICYMRSGSSSIAYANCDGGKYASTQSKY